MIASFDGVAIRTYYSLPSAGREDIVIVLPLATKSSLIAPAIDRLSQDYNVITWESRLILEPNMAMEDPESLSIESSIKDFVAILDYFRISSASVVGYCSGASAALHMVASNIGRVRRLALLNGAYFMTNGECDLTQYEKDIMCLVPQIATSHHRASYIFRKFFRNGAAASKFGNQEFAGETYRPYGNADSLYRFGLGLRNFMTSDSKDKAREITVPALVTSSRRDDQTHYSSSILIRSQLHEAEFYMDNTGDHYEFCRAKPELLGRITEFFSRC